MQATLYFICVISALSSNGVEENRVVVFYFFFFFLPRALVLFVYFRGHFGVLVQ